MHYQRSRYSPIFTFWNDLRRNSASRERTAARQVANGDMLTGGGGSGNCNSRSRVAKTLNYRSFVNILEADTVKKKKMKLSAKIQHFKQSNKVLRSITSLLTITKF